MNSKYIIILTIILSTKIVIAQNWERYFGSNGDYSNSRDVIETYDYGYMIAGRILYESKEWLKDSWLIKTDVNGNLLWDKLLINSDKEVFINAIDNTIDGGIVASGSINISIHTYPFILKLNACGEKEWCHRIPGALNELPWAEDVKELPNGNIVMLVNMFGDGTYESLHLFMMDSIGQILWQNPYCSGFEHDLLRPLGESIQITSDNKIIICGSSYWKNPWEPGSEYYWIRPTFTKVDPESGDEEWVLPFGLEDTITGDAYSFVGIAQNNIVGIASDWRGDAETNPIFIRFNSSGLTLDYKTIYAETIDASFTEGSLENIFLVNDKYYANGGFEIGNDEYIPLTNVIIDTNLFFSAPNIEAYEIHDNKHWPYSMITTFDTKFISSATFQESGNWDIYLTKRNLALEQDSIYSAPYTYDSLCPHPILSGFISLDDCFPVGVDEGIPTPHQYFDSISTIQINTYPNPASGHINFSLKNTEHHSNIILETYNIHGQLIEKREISKGQQAVTIDLSIYSNGIYAVFISSNQNKSAGKSKFAVQRP